MRISDTGFLLKSGSVIQTGPMEFSITYNAPYAEFIEFGTDPHTVPFDIILKWVRRKLGITREREAKRIAWFIVRKIQQQGIQPKPFLRNAIDSIITRK